MTAFLALAVSIVLGVAGQLGLKAGALQDVIRQGWIPHPYIFLGLGFYVISFLFYIFALRKIPVSVAFPSVSISYVAVAYLASLIWKEPFGWQQIVALLFIGFGIFMLVQYGR